MKHHTVLRTSDPSQTESSADKISEIEKVNNFN